MAILAVERDADGAYAGLVLLTEPEAEAPMMDSELVGGPGSDFEEDLLAARERAEEIGEALVEEASVAEYRTEHLAAFENADLAELGRIVVRLLREETATVEESRAEGGESRHRLLVWEPYDEPEPVACAEIGEGLAGRLARRYGIEIRPAGGDVGV